MARGILTNREVKNKVTGVDIYVSDYQEVPHRLRNEYLYHVIVVSNLFYYKTREHRESDVVQFMVSKTFAEFEDLYKRLFKRFPSVNFPPLPEKSLFSRNNAGGNLECMDKVLKMVASTVKLSSSPMVISFLRGDPLPNTKDTESPDDEEEPSEQPDGPSEPSVNNDDEFQDVNLFVSKPQVVVEDIICAENVEPVSSGKSIFDDDGVDGENDSDLFNTDDTKTSTDNKGDYLNAELNFLELSDEVDELMNLSRMSEKLSIKVHKPQAKQKVNPSKRIVKIPEGEPSGKEDMFKRSKHKSFLREHDHHRIDDIFGPKKTSLFDMDDDDDIFRTSSTKKAVQVEDMKQADIMDYIKAHDGCSVNTVQSDAVVFEQDIIAVNNITFEEPIQIFEPTEKTECFVTDNNDSRMQTGHSDTHVLEQNESSVLMDSTSITGQADRKSREEVGSYNVACNDISGPEDKSDASSYRVIEQAESSPMEETSASVTEQADSSALEHADSLVSSESASVSVTEHTGSLYFEYDGSIAVEENDGPISTEGTETFVTMHTAVSGSEQVDIFGGKVIDSSVATEHTEAFLAERIESYGFEHDDITVLEEDDIPITTEETETFVTKKTDASASEQVNIFGVEMSDGRVETEQIEASLTVHTDIPSLEHDDVMEENDRPTATEETGIFETDGQIHTFVGAENDVSITTEHIEAFLTEQADSPVLEQNDMSVPTQEDVTCPSTEKNYNTIQTVDGSTVYLEYTDNLITEENNTNTVQPIQNDRSAVIEERTSTVITTQNDLNVNVNDNRYVSPETLNL